MAYNSTFDKLNPDVGAIFKSTLQAVQDNVTEMIGAYTTDAQGLHHPKGDFNAIFQDFLNNQSVLKDMVDTLDQNKLDRGGYAGTAQNLKSEVDDKLPKGTYAGDAGQLKTAIDLKLAAGTYTGNAGQLKSAVDLKQNKNDSGLHTTSKTVVGSINETLGIAQSNSANKQNKNDSTLGTSNKTVVGAINELNSGKEPKFNKNSGFNKPITSSYTLNNSGYVASAKSVYDLYANRSNSHTNSSNNVLATVGGVKTAYDRGTSAYNLANSKEPKFSKNSGFNLNKSNSITSTSQTTLATSYAVKQVNDKIDGLFGISTTNSEKTLDMGIFKVKIKSITATGPANVDFEVPFENECFTVIFTDEGNSFSSQRLNSFNSTGFNVSTSSVGDKFRYLAIGY